MDYDLVVVGGGLAGLTAGLYGARFGMKTAIVEQMMPGGQIVNVERIEDFPGFADGVVGAELGSTVHEQAEAAGAGFVMDEVTGIDRDGDGFIVRGGSGEYRARAVIAASGSRRRGLAVPGDPDLRGYGVSECATCDGNFYVGQRVAVVGGGDSAVSEAIGLLDQGIGEVLMIHRGDALDAQKVWQDRLAARTGVAVHLHTHVVEITGDGGVTGVKLQTAGQEPRLEPVHGVFVYLGLQPNTDWLTGLIDLGEGGRVATDPLLMTAVPGLFAAGDIRQYSMAQLVASAGDGASAAVAAARFLAGRR